MAGRIRHSVQVTAGPSAEPVTLVQAKAQCRVEHTADDGLFVGTATHKGWIKAARELVEATANRKLLAQTVAVVFDAFPCGVEALELPVWPVQSVTGVSYKRAEDGADTPLTDFQAWLGHDPPLLAPAAGTWWPAVQCGALAPVTITLVCGDAAANVPGHAAQAILLTLGYWYGFRGDGKDPAADESIPGEAGLPAGAVRLIGLLERKRYG